jgi:hypothetical protein
LPEAANICQALIPVDNVCKESRLPSAACSAGEASAAIDPLAGLGTDNLADGWRMALSNRPQQWSEAVRRIDSSSEFWFGSLRIYCKSLGLNVTVQLPSKETMTVDKFLDKFGPLECASLNITSMKAQESGYAAQIDCANPEENANC